MGSEAESERLLRERYRLTEELGRGGMGRVWKAHDEGLNRTVAIKEILPDPGLSEDERARAAARARREAQAAAMGSHPNIVTVHDIFEEDGRPWIVMEFLTGCSLFDLVRREGVRPAPEIARWGLDLVGALDTAHRQGITHRDVKPENVMVTDDGRVVLTDFGIATIADTASLTQTVGIMGSPAYLAPERLSNGPATPAGDLWSLGATLYHAATGISPFRREGVPATLNAILNQEPAERLAPGALREAVHGLLTKDPARRLDAERCRALLSAAAEPPAPSAARAHPSGAQASPVAPQVPLPGPTAPRGPLGPLPAAPHPPATTPPGGAVPRPLPAAAGADGTRRTALTDAFVPPRPARRGGRLSWPMVVLALGLALVVAGATLVVVMDPWSAPAGTALSGTGNDASDGTPRADASAAGASGEDAAVSQEPQEPQGPPGYSGTTWSEDPEGFTVLVPDGWIRRVSGASVFYDAPDSGAYLQVDRTAHPTDDEYRHVLDQEQTTDGRLEEYERIRIEDVTDRTPFHSAADWEFSWTTEGRERRVLARNIAVSPGVHYTVVWAAPTDVWFDQGDMRTAVLDSFEPA
ncbi:Serine_threonine-protein kinase PknD [Nocardiopsis dassonvillei]|uniref:serine/threonine-protein kinase n=1 Tax=Nocardiopsis dassonvillei TaxID=2014 RepID=UPI003F57CE46